MRFIITLLALVALAWPAWADGWDANGTGTGTGAWSKSSVGNGVSYLAVPDAENDNDFSTKVGALGDGQISICYDDDITAQAATGSGEIEVYWSAIPDGDSLLGYVALIDVDTDLVVTLTAADPCVPVAPRAWYRFKITVPPDTDGLLTVSSSN